MKFAINNTEFWEHIGYTFQKSIRNITEIEAKREKIIVWQSASCEAKFNVLAESVKQAPKLSTGWRLLKTNLNISHTSAWRTLRKSVKLFPYRIQVANILTPADCVKRVAMANWPMPSMKTLVSPGGFSSVSDNDESHFYLNGVMNKASCVF